MGRRKRNRRKGISAGVETEVSRKVDQFRRQLASLDYLVFTFQQIRTPGGWICASVVVAGAIQSDGIVQRVDDRHPVPSAYIQLQGVCGLDVEVDTKAAARMLKLHRCLVVERWGVDFICRIPTWLRENIGRGTTGVTNLNQSVVVVRKLQEVSRSLTWRRIGSVG